MARDPLPRRLALAALAATFIILLSAWIFRARPEIQVERAHVTAGPIARRILATGTVTPVETVEVGSQVSGIVQSLDVDFNAVVHAGQVVARLDPSLYQAALDQARAGLREAEAAFYQAQADLTGLRTAEGDARLKLDRAEELAAKKLIADADLDAAHIAMDEAGADVRSGEARLDQAIAAIAQARAEVEHAMVDLDHTVIRSPIDGIVVARNVDVGQTLAATIQTPVLFAIASDFTHVRVQVDLDEADIDGVTDGEPVSFHVESYPDEFHGIVTQLRSQPVAQQTAIATTAGTPPAPGPSSSSSVVATVVTYTAIVDVANADEKLRPGMTAAVALAGSRRERAVRIPNGALGFHPSADVLRLLDETDPTSADAVKQAEGGRAVDVWTYDGKRFTPVPVHVGLSNDSWTELVSGSIRPGDEVVTSAEIR